MDLQVRQNFTPEALAKGIETINESESADLKNEVALLIKAIVQVAKKTNPLKDKGLVNILRQTREKIEGLHKEVKPQSNEDSERNQGFHEIKPQDNDFIYAERRPNKIFYR